MQADLFVGFAANPVSVPSRRPWNQSGYYAAFPGCAEQSEPSAGTVAFLIEKVREEDIPVVFYLELSNGKVAKTIAESSDAQAMQFNSCHNVTMDQFLDGVTYVDLMSENVEALEKALNWLF